MIDLIKHDGHLIGLTVYWIEWHYDDGPSMVIETSKVHDIWHNFLHVWCDSIHYTKAYDSYDEAKQELNRILSSRVEEGERLQKILKRDKLALEKLNE